MKPIAFLGDSLKQLRSFGRDAVQDVGSYTWCSAGSGLMM